MKNHYCTGKPFFINSQVFLIKIIYVSALSFIFGIGPFASLGQEKTLLYLYDNNNQLIQVKFQDGMQVNYSYDDVGNRLSKTLLQPSLSKKVYLDHLFLEGLYAGNHQMNPAYDNIGPHWPDSIADHITVELHDHLNYSSIKYSADVALGRNGTATLMTPSELGNTYYLTIKHKNSIETVSALPIDFSGSVIDYSFNTQSKAYGNNLAVMIDGTVVLFAGDENQDGLIDGSDLNDIGNMNAIFARGYIREDINGDGLVDGTDINITGNNDAQFIHLSHP
jgi:YD repeat-containing protein